MKCIATAISLTVWSLVPLPALAENGTVQLQSKDKIERKQVSYDCGPAGRLAVVYVNADPNFLAIVPLPSQPQPTIFVSVLSGSGARYAAGKYVWWAKGPSANLYDSTAGDSAAPALTCNEVK